MQIKEIHLETHKLQALKTFYTQTLELPMVKEKKQSFTIEAGVSKITFSEATSSKQPLYHFAFNIPENQLAEAKQWLLSRTKLIEKEGRDQFRFESWNADSVYFNDPAGNIVEFIARHNLDNASEEEKFSANSILSVSEIGIPVEDVRLFSQHLQQEQEIPLWDGDEKKFAALGDEEGLFIVVPLGRPWLPVGPPAKEFPVTVDI